MTLSSEKVAFGHLHPVAPSGPETEKITSISRMVHFLLFLQFLFIYLATLSLSCST